MGWLRQIAWASIAVVAAVPWLRAESAACVEPDLVALSRLTTVKLPPVPAYAGSPVAPCSLDDLTAQFAKVTDHMPTINSNAVSFVLPDRRWLLAYTDWFMKLQKALKFTYKDETFDCKNFARSFVAFADVVALNAGERRASVCVGWGIVSNERSFGGVPGSNFGMHAIVVVATVEGWLVIEPQSGAVTSLKDYPNRDAFEELYL